MATVVRYTWIRLRGQMLGWGIALAALGLIIALFYDTAVQQRAALEKLISSLPREVTVFIGNIDELFSPAGYLNARYFSLLPLILGAFAIIVGSGLIVSDEENGTLDLILAHPISRVQLCVGRSIALVAAVVGISVIAWLGLVIATITSSFAVNVVEALMPFLSLFAVLIWFGAFALMLSMILPSRRLAASLSGLLLVAGFFITSLARISSDLAPIAALSPLNYYQGGDAMKAFNWGWFGGLLIMAVIFAAIAVWRFERRDIRIAGEGVWRLPGRPASALPTT